VTEYRCFEIERYTVGACESEVVASALREAHICRMSVEGPMEVQVLLEVESESFLFLDLDTDCCKWYSHHEVAERKKKKIRGSYDRRIDFTLPLERIHASYPLQYQHSGYATVTRDGESEKHKYRKHSNPFLSIAHRG
jgi:hypothetical protein